MATKKEIPDVNQLTVESRLNGEVMQHASVADLIYTLPVIIEYLSGFTNLYPGDVIATGTPGGVGDRREPPVYMKVGDVIEAKYIGNDRKGRVMQLSIRAKDEAELQESLAEVNKADASSGTTKLGALLREQMGKGE